jgi:hypothetical protein
VLTRRSLGADHQAAKRRCQPTEYACALTLSSNLNASISFAQCIENVFKRGLNHQPASFSRDSKPCKKTKGRDFETKGKSCTRKVQNFAANPGLGYKYGEVRNSAKVDSAN